MAVTAALAGFLVVGSVVFIERVMIPLLRDLPQLRVVLEHITTRDAAEFVANSPSTVAATITVHHLLYNRNAMLVGGIRPHFYCLPVLKTEPDRRALLAGISLTLLAAPALAQAPQPGLDRSAVDDHRAACRRQRIGRAQAGQCRRR